MTRLAPDRRASDYHPTWSPDGRHIAFVSSGALYVMRADGTDIRRVYRLRGAQIEDPSWSPRGRWIAVAVDLGFDPYYDTKGSLALINAKGTSIRYLTDTRVGRDSRMPGEWVDDGEPDWSADGTRIVFTRNVYCDPDGCGGFHELYTIDADGTDLAPLTSFRAGQDGWSPSWSRGGKRIVANTSRGMVALPLPGTGLFVGAVIDASGTEPAWQPWQPH